MRATCVAFAAGAFNDLVDGDEFATEFLAWCAVEVSGVGDERAGVPLQSAGDVMVRLGQPLEALWPYQIAPAGSPPVSVFRAARLLRRTSHQTAFGFDSTMALSELNAGHSVVLGLRVTPTFYRVSLVQPNLDEDTSPTATFLHAVALVGHLGTTHPWVLRNSWGLSWGDAGHAYASDQFLRAHVREMLTLEA